MRLLVACAPGERLQLSPRLLQIGETPLEPTQPVVNELADVLVRWLTAVVDVEDLANLAQHSTLPPEHRE